MNLGYLFPNAFTDAEERREVLGLTMDSRQVGPGAVFVAVAGSRVDGASYIPQAVAHGAIAVVGEGPRPANLRADVAYAQVADARRELALAAARVHPRQPSNIVAVTGTSGKSSVVDFARQIYTSCGRAAASVGTVGIVSPNGADYGSLTTPDPLKLHDTLDTLAGDGVTHLAMEASSHGLDQRRLDGVRLKAGAFTNLGRDHLDYHPTMEAYFAAKLRLFDTLLPRGAGAAIYVDSPEGSRAANVAARHGLKVIGIGERGDQIRLERLERHGFSQRLSLSVYGRPCNVDLPLVGDFQAANALVAAGLALATGEDQEAVIAALGELKGVKGRMERVAQVNGALVLVDYAHKPDALAHVLDALRPYTTGRLICVFGAGGDRDTGKRPLMGAIAAEKADIVIVTDDNPRSEDPAAIRAAIVAAAPGAREIGDRREAIAAAMTMLRTGDVLVIAGKGHETGQIIGSRTFPFSDHEVVAELLREGAR